MDDEDIYGDVYAFSGAENYGAQTDDIKPQEEDAADGEAQPVSEWVVAEAGKEEDAQELRGESTQRSAEGGSGDAEAGEGGRLEGSSGRIEGEELLETLRSILFPNATRAADAAEVLEAVRALHESATQLKGEVKEARRREAVMMAKAAGARAEAMEIRRSFRAHEKAALPHVIQLRQLLLDPAVHREFKHLQGETERLRKELQQTREDLSATVFSHESQIGRQLVAKLRKVLQENEELGARAGDGRVSELGTQLAVALQHAQQLLKRNQELQQHCSALDAEAEGLQLELLRLRGSPAAAEDGRAEDGRAAAAAADDECLPPPPPVHGHLPSDSGGGGATAARGWGNGAARAPKRAAPGGWQSRGPGWGGGRGGKGGGGPRKRPFSDRQAPGLDPARPPPAPRSGPRV